MNSKPEASIIIPVFNQMHYTKQCIESIERDQERCPFEIIVIDNGSTDGTRQYLESKSRDYVSMSARDHFLAIYNESIHGVASAWNQGVKASHGKTLAILNNDILLPKGWYRSLLWAMDFHHISLACPFSVTGTLNYDFESRVKSFTQKNVSKIWKTYDFCAFTFSRHTYNSIGPFDEKFQIGGYEDTDYCYRLEKAGLRYGITGAAFIHHFGSQTLNAFKKSGDQHGQANLQYFVEKWGIDPGKEAHQLPNRLRQAWKKFKLQWDRM